MLIEGYMLTASIERPTADLVRACEQGEFITAEALSEDRLCLGLRRPENPFNEYFIDPFQELPLAQKNQPGAHDLPEIYYDIPSIIWSQENARYGLAAQEVGSWPGAGAETPGQAIFSASVVGKFMGKALAPSVIHRPSANKDDWHPCSATFIRYGLGRASVDTESGPRYRLIFDHASLMSDPFADGAGGRVGVRSAVLRGDLTRATSGDLFASFSTKKRVQAVGLSWPWKKAIKALGEKAFCEGCDSLHYTADE